MASFLREVLRNMSQGRLGRFLCGCFALDTNRARAHQGELLSVIGDDDDSDGSPQRSGRSARAQDTEPALPRGWGSGWQDRGSGNSRGGGAAAPAEKAVAKEPPKPSYDKEADEDIFGDAGQPCCICNAETRIQTHFSMPCRHAACEQCWKTWLKDHSTCLLCGNKVEATARFSARLVPVQAGESGSLEALNNELEQALAVLIQTLVSIKSRLTEVSEKLGEADSHLRSSSMRRMGGDARAGVAAVEASALTDQIQALRHLMRPQDGTHSLWGRLRGAVKGMDGVLKKLGVLLDNMSEGDFGPGPDGRKRGAPRHLDTTMRLLDNCTSGMIMGQWRPLAGTLRRALEEQVPKLMMTLHMYGALSPGSELVLEPMQQEANERLEASERGLAGLLPEVDLIMIRVQSCFDFDGEPEEGGGGAQPVEA